MNRIQAIGLPLAVLLLAGCTPSTEVKKTQTALPLQPRLAQEGPYQLALTVDPMPPKYLTNTEFTVFGRTADTGPLTGATVTVELVMNHRMSKILFTLKGQEAGRYQGTGSFSMGGDWEAIVTAKKNGKTGTARFKIPGVTWDR